MDAFDPADLQGFGRHLGRDGGAGDLQVAQPDDERDLVEVRGGLQLFAERDALGAFDAVLASVAASRSIRALVSADRAFANIPGLAHVYPDERGISELLAAR